MKVYLTSDHGGYELKGKLKGFLGAAGYAVEDLGPYSLDPQDDYVDYAVKGAKALLSDEPDKNRLIMACRTGEGEVIVANRFPGVRAVVVWNTEGAKLAREKNDSNVLCLSGDLVDTSTNEEIVKVWLETPFSKEDRHMRRLKKIDDITV